MEVFHLLLLLGGIVALTGNAWAKEAGGFIVLRESAEVRGPWILLRDIASIQADDSSLVEKLERIQVGRAPLPGLTRTLDLDRIKSRLRQHRINLALLRIEGPRAIVVTAGSRLIRGEELFQAAKAYVVERWKGEEDLLISPAPLPPDLIIPSGEHQLKARPSLKSNLLGSTPLVVEVWVDGRLYRSVNVGLKVSPLGEVVVAARPVPRHALLQPEDLKLERRDLSALPSEAIRDPEKAVGRRTTKALSKGEVLLPKAVEDPPWVKKGDFVTLVAEAPGLTITVQGQAREEGSRGQLIRVRNVSSGREVYGRVESPQVVRVSF